MIPYLEIAAGRFSPFGEITGIAPYGSGNIHRTFRVTGKGSGRQPFLLQCVNTFIFSRPEQVTHNIRSYCDHALKKLAQQPLGPERRWEVPRIIPDRDGMDLWKDPQGSYWRAFHFIDRATSIDVVQNERQAVEVGFALGTFHRLVRDLPVGNLFETLPGFHITPAYLVRFDRVLAQFHPPKSSEVDWALAFVQKRRALAFVLEKAKAEGRLPLRTIHGDPKVNNVLFDTVTGRAVSLVDLDTIQPGLIHYDLGDCLRSCGNPLGEESERWEAVRFQTDLCARVWDGYLPEAGTCLEENDYAYLFEALRLIAFELGLRFLTDFLEGNVYFPVKHPQHNLFRALVQFRLTESIEEQEQEIRAVFRKRGTA